MRVARILAISIAVLLLLPAISAPAYASTAAHGCAQPVPPIMPGSPGPPPATPGIILINEVLNNPNSNWNCSEPGGSFSLSTDSWLELYNPQNQPFNLYEARASLDNGNEDMSFHFPFGSDIAAHGYLVVFPETYVLDNTLLDGNTVRLLFGGTTIIDLVSTPALPADNTYARIPDGSTNWQITSNPTIDASNLASKQVAPTPTKVPTKTPGSSSSSGYGPGNTANPTPTHITGKQPAWGKLQLPATNSTTTSTTNSPLVASPTTSPPASPWNTPRRILLTVLVVALVLSLFWCWKLYSSA